MSRETNLSLEELERFDRAAPVHGRERRFCCPLCHDDRPKDASHRSLSLNAETGLWNCHRCGAAGKLKERWEMQTRRRREIGRNQIRRAFNVSPSIPPAAPDNSGDWRRHLEGLQKLQGTPGADYLSSRGIPAEIAHAAGVRFAANWYGRPAVVFPIRNREGTLTAANGRYVDGRTDPKTRTAGPVSAGVFATPGAWETDPLILVEAPLDALSLAACGYPAIATIGCTLQDWLRWECGFQRILIGTDADAAGDAAAEAWKTALRAAGTGAQRLRPEGGKDWNEALQADPAGLREFLRAALEPKPPAIAAENSEALAELRALADRLGEQARGMEGVSDEDWPAFKAAFFAADDELAAGMAALGVDLAELGWRIGPGGRWLRVGEPEPQHQELLGVDMLGVGE